MIQCGQLQPSEELSTPACNIRINDLLPQLKTHLCVNCCGPEVEVSRTRPKQENGQRSATKASGKKSPKLGRPRRTAKNLHRTQPLIKPVSLAALGLEEGSQEVLQYPSQGERSSSYHQSYRYA